MSPFDAKAIWDTSPQGECVKGREMSPFDLRDAKVMTEGLYEEEACYWVNPWIYAG
jgi:hypothetical protein